MESSIHHLPSNSSSRKSEPAPEPASEKAAWKEALACAMGEDAQARWGKQLLRVTNDMVVICDEELNIVYHNRGFVRGIGFFRGSYEKQSFLSFFPSADRAEALKAFQGLIRSQQGGMRFGATMLTKRGERPFDARVVRSLRADGRYLFYAVIREEKVREVDLKKTERQASELLLAGLPVAAFRTDQRLRIIRAFGSLWDELKIDPATIKGADLSNPQCHLAPPFLHEIDYCDTMAGLSLHADLAWKQEPYEITVEPFLDKNRRVIGAIGMLRKAKTDPVHLGAEHLSIPMPVDPTTPLKHTRPVNLSMGPVKPPRPQIVSQAPSAPPTPQGQPTAPPEPIRLGVEHLSTTAPLTPIESAMRPEHDLVSKIRSDIKPRRLAPPDINGIATEKTEPVALAN